MRFLIVVTLICLALLLFHAMAENAIQRAIEERFAWAQFTYNYSQHLWCVDAQLRTGQQIGTCKPTRREAELDLLERSNTKVVEK